MEKARNGCWTRRVLSARDLDPEIKQEILQNVVKMLRNNEEICGEFENIK